DSWGGVLADGDFQAFSLAYTRKILAGLQREAEGRRVPSIVFTKGGGLWLDEIANAGSDAVGVDWTVNLARARSEVGDRVALHGHLGPMMLSAPLDDVAAQARRVRDAFGPVTAGHGPVFNLGHGISQFTPPEAVKRLVATVHEYSRGLHARQ